MAREMEVYGDEENRVFRKEARDTDKGKRTKALTNKKVEAKKDKKGKKKSFSLMTYAGIEPAIF